MESNTVRNTAPEEEIDLLELVAYIGRRWRVLIVAVLIGILLGSVVGFLKPAPSVDSLDIEKLHLKELEQYARYQALYDEQEKWEQESVYLNMDPNNAYTGNIRYYLYLKKSDSAMISQLYDSILGGEGVYERLLEASGLNCSLRAIQELAAISSQSIDAQDQNGIYGEPLQETQLTVSDNPSQTVQVMVTATAPSEEACQAMLELMDDEVAEMNRYVEATYGAVVKERLTTPCKKSAYHAEIAQAKLDSTELLSTYNDKITTIAKNLTDDDKLYYSLIYGEEIEEAGLGWLKAAIFGGLLFGVLSVSAYCTGYLMNGTIKNVDELRCYGLHRFAVLEEVGPKKKLNALDRLFTPKLRVQSDDYLVQALEVIHAEHIVLCGDLNDPEIAAHAQRIGAANAKLSVEPQMVQSAETQMKACQADGVLLLVRLWKTARADLEQEIRICQKLGISILGVAVIE